MKPSKTEITVNVFIKQTIWFKICLFKIYVMSNFNPYGSLIFTEQVINDLSNNPSRYIKVKQIKEK